MGVADENEDGDDREAPAAPRSRSLRPRHAFPIQIAEPGDQGEPERFMGFHASALRLAL